MASLRNFTFFSHCSWKVPGTPHSSKETSLVGVLSTSVIFYWPKCDTSPFLDQSLWSSARRSAGLNLGMRSVHSIYMVTLYWGWVSTPKEIRFVLVGKKMEMDAEVTTNKYPLFCKMCLKLMQKISEIKMCISSSVILSLIVFPISNIYST